PRRLLTQAHPAISVNANNPRKFPTRMGQPQDLEQLNTPAGWPYSRWCPEIPIIAETMVGRRHDKRLESTAFRQQGSTKIASFETEHSGDAGTIRRRCAFLLIGPGDRVWSSGLASIAGRLAAADRCPSTRRLRRRQPPFDWHASQHMPTGSRPTSQMTMERGWGKPLLLAGLLIVAPMPLLAETAQYRPSEA